MNVFENFLQKTYEIVDVIKSEEKNFVATAYDKNSKRLCVIKKRNLKSFELYKILQEMKNEHIPEIYRLFSRDGNLIVIEEHIDGQNLEEIFSYKTKKFDEKLVKKIFLQICTCLEKIHEKNIIHRDIKPSNIMLTKNNFVKIIDFGIARIFDPEKIYDTEFLGTRGYAAPEQYGLFDLGQTDSRTDIFNLGMTMKNLLGENYHGRLEKILNRCTNLNPDFRYKNISELISDVKRREKIFYLKRIGFIFFGTIIFFTAMQFIKFENKIESPPVEIEEKIHEEEKIIEEVSRSQGEKVESVFEFPQIIFPEIKIPDAPKTENLPPPVEKIPDPTQEIKKADKPKIFLYINGKLTENYGKVAGYVYVDGFETWKTFEKGSYYKYFLFPDNWTAQLKIENFTDKDLITPKIIVSFSADKNKIIIEQPTIKAGQVDFVDIPIANRLAMSILGVNKDGTLHVYGNFHIELKSPGVEKIQLIRYLRTSDEDE